MPLYEFECPRCKTRDEVFARTVSSPIEAPPCPAEGCGGTMNRLFSPFARHLTMTDKLAEAEARFGKEVDAAMGPEPDIGRHARRYESLAKDLPPPDTH